MSITHQKPPTAPSGSAKGETDSPQPLPAVVYLLGAVAFLMGTTELVVAGLLPEVSTALSVPQARAGLLITTFAVGMIVGAPLMSMATLRLPARATLVSALLVFCAAHVVAATTSSFSLQLGARFLAAVATGTFWAVGAVVATAAVGREASAKATAVMIGGLTLANVLGVPLGTSLGQWMGWRSPFWVLAVLAALAALVLARRLPRSASQQTTTVSVELSSLKHGRLWLVYLACGLVPGSFIAAYSYISPLLTERAGLAAGVVPVVMLGYGLATLVGTAFGGRAGDRHPFAVAIPAVAMIAVTLTGLTLWGAHPVAAVGFFIVLGLVAMVAQPILISQVVMQAGDHHTLAVALSTSALNVGIASGSAAGGSAMAAHGLSAPSLLGAVVAMLALVVLFVLGRTGRRQLG